MTSPHPTTPPGTRVAYACDQCRAIVVTITVDRGTLPLAMRCRGAIVGRCPGVMRPTPDVPTTAPIAEWIRGDASHPETPKSVREYVASGGLSLRPKGAPPA